MRGLHQCIQVRGEPFVPHLRIDLKAEFRGELLLQPKPSTGTKVYGKVADAQQAGRYAKTSKLDLRLAELTVGGALVPIMTGPYAQAGANSMGKTAKGAAAGAAIGAMSGDAGKGAAIGAMASGLKKGQPVVVSPGTLLEFQLQQPVTVNPAR